MELNGAQIEALADLLVDSHDELLSSLVGMRKKHGLSQEQVAERMGVSQPAVASFERYDANPTLATIRRYALAVQASIEHRVVDQCCISVARVASGNASRPVSWNPRQSVEWEWAVGETHLKAFVNA